MKIFTLLLGLVCLTIASCNTKGESNGNSSIQMDTIYATNPETDLNYKDLIIKLRSDSSMVEAFELKKGISNYVKISFPNYPNYPEYLKNEENVKVEYADHDEGVFYLTPLDSVCQFDVYLDFGENNVVLKYTAKNSNDYKVKPYDGLRMVARIKETVF